ncbi:MAG TPA: phosphonate dehydrogenase [Alphaproteobacteria bacterium]|nr:phosphonate dehydrogenase [Alphaproteobacteria bacterium]
MEKRIVVTSRSFPETIALLERWGTPVVNQALEPWPADVLAKKTQDAVAMMAFMPDSVDDAFLSACPKLKVIACALKGYDNFDVEACTRRGIWLTIVPDLLTEPTAELTIGLMLGLSRHILQADDYVRAGRFAGWRPILYGTSIDGSTVGILGGGAVGKAIARKLAGFDCRTLVYDQKPGGSLSANASWASMDEIARAADFLVLALPLTPSTLHLVNELLLRQLKPGCLLINPARGSLVNETHVANALRTGGLGGYAADVYEMEDWARADRPRSLHPELLGMRDRTLFTAHLGSAVTRVRREIERDAATNIGEVLSGQRPHGAVNKLDAGC